MNDAVKTFQTACEKAKVPVCVVLRLAGVAPSTWYRWQKSHFDPRAATLSRLQTALQTAAKPTKRKKAP